MAGSPNRNAPCPCGSGRKYKSCCLRKDKAAPLPSRSGDRPGSARPPTPADASNTPELLRQARDLRRLSRWGQAVTAYRAVLERRPRDAEALFGLGQSLARINEPDAALVCTRQAVEIEPGNGDYHVELAWQLGQANQPDPALHHARRAVELVPNNVKAHYTLALCHERANRLDDAAKSIERALRSAPEDANAGIIGAVLARRRGDPTDARRRLEAIVGRSPGDQYLAWALNELARACDELEAWDDAWTAIVASGEALGRTSEARRLDRDTHSRLLAAYRDAVTPELLLRHRAVEPTGGRAGPVFLVGFPRSGTTMTEMLMAAHP